VATRLDYQPTQTVPSRIDVALLALRIASASAFLYHGGAILLGAFGGPGPRDFAASHGWPTAVACMVGLAQVFGGVAVLSGILTRLGAACLIVVMVGAIVLVHLPHGFDVSNGGVEYALTQMLVATALLFAGPGALSFAGVLPPAWRGL
jgi:putative oxidoreductase